MIIRRIWRLLPSEMFVIGLVLLLPLQGYGPVHNDVISFNVDNCRNYWWRNALFISNYYKITEMCIGHTWYISVDIQFYLTGIIYFILYFRNAVWGYAFLILTGLASVIYAGTIVYLNNYLPAPLLIVVDFEYLTDYMTTFYISSFVNWSVYAIGLGLGSYLARANKCKLTMSWAFFGWIVAVVGGLVNVYIVYKWNYTIAMPSTFDRVTYASLHRCGWAVCVSWVVYVCAVGWGGFVNKLLSWNGFMPAVRVSYLMYLLHMPIITFFNSNLQGTIDTSHYVVVWQFLGTLCVTGIVSVACRLVFEGPISALDSIFFRAVRKRTEKKKQARDEKKTSEETPREAYINTVAY